MFEHFIRGIYLFEKCLSRWFPGKYYKKEWYPQLSFTQVHLEILYRIFCYLQKNLGKNPGRVIFYGEFNTSTDEAIFYKT